MEIFHNAKIFSPEYPTATAVVIDHGRFLALGSDSEILAGFSSTKQCTDLQGKTLWPGLTDAHVHLRLLAETMAMIDCETSTRQSCISRIKQTADTLPEGAWVRGHGWNQNQWEEGFGNAAMLDNVCGDRPAYLTAKSLHAAWANSTAMSLAGITGDTPDPAGGTIQRDQHGQPTGILLEAGAMQLIESIIPAPTTAEIIAKFKVTLPELWKVGLVGIHDFDDFACWLALQSLYQAGSFGLRVRKHIPFDHMDEFINAGLHTGFGDDWLNIGGVKLFSDGALGPQTAAMLKPFEDTQESGTLLMDQDALVEAGEQAVAHGISLAVHAIGDRANRVVLDAYQRLRSYERAHHLPHLHHRIEHVQIIDPADISRLAELDIVASVQPIHAPSDMLMADRSLGSRSQNAYAYQSILEAGAAYVLGSDAPVEPVNPFFGLHAAVTRRRSDGSPGPQGWHPNQRLTLEEALNGFTITPAVVAGRGNRLGKIAPGYHADFIILEKDPFALEPHELCQIKPQATFIAGECKYQSQDIQADFTP
ncbi:MAG: amidohydrolase [Brevefilum sp.]|nr:amidohydrolase [Brevefilum sp.]